MRSHDSTTGGGRVGQTSASLWEAMDSQFDPYVLLEPVYDGEEIVDFTFADANRAACLYNGVPYDDLMGHRLLGLLPAHDPTGMLGFYIRVIQTGEPLALDDFEFFDALRSGDQRRYDVRAVKVGESLSCTWRDVTERFQRAQALATSEREYRLLAENATDVVFRMNAEAVIEWMSPSVTRLLGWEPAELVGTRGCEFVHEDDVALVVERRAAAHDGEESVDFEARFHTADGGHRWMAVHARPVRELDGSVVGDIVGLRDVDTEVRQRQAMAEHEARYRLLADHARDVVVLSRPNALEWVSPSATELLGYDPADFIGTALVDLVHPDDRAAAVEAQARLLAGEPIELRARVPDVDGVWHWFEGRLRPVPDDDGEYRGRSVAAYRQIDHEVAAAEALARSIDELTTARNEAEAERERVTATIDSLLDPHVLMRAVRDTTGTIVDFVHLDANQAACDFLHRSRDEVLGTHLSDMLPDDLFVELLAAYAGTIETGEPTILDDLERPPTDRYGANHVEIRAQRIGDTVVVSWRDVTERHRAAELLASSARRFRRLHAELEDLLAHGTILGLRSDRHGIIVWVSQSVSEILGCEPADVLHHSVEEWIHPADLLTVLEAREQLLAGRERLALSFRARHADGTYRHLDGAAFLADDAVDGTGMLQVTLTDVTEREQTRQLREQVIAVASHELRSPLAFLSGALRLFEAGAVSRDESGADLLARMTATSDRLARIADSLLHLQQLELAAPPMPTDSVDAATVISEALATVPLERGIGLEFREGPVPAGALRIDTDELARAATNLVVNAVKHSPDGGIVTITLEGYDGGLRLTVSDHGPGVAPEHRADIFTAFHQLRRSSSAGGVGLGLAIVSKIAERYRGRVWAEDNPAGPGARFVLELRQPNPAGDLSSR